LWPLSRLAGLTKHLKTIGGAVCTDAASPTHLQQRLLKHNYSRVGFPDAWRRVKKLPVRAAVLRCVLDASLLQAFADRACAERTAAARRGGTRRAQQAACKHSGGLQRRARLGRARCPVRQGRASALQRAAERCGAEGSGRAAAKPRLGSSSRTAHAPVDSSLASRPFPGAARRAATAASSAIPAMLGDSSWLVHSYYLILNLRSDAGTMGVGDGAWGKAPAAAKGRCLWQRLVHTLGPTTPPYQPAGS
jgi:hypothetical protein